MTKTEMEPRRLSTTEEAWVYELCAVIVERAVRPGFTVIDSLGLRKFLAREIRAEMEKADD